MPASGVEAQLRTVARALGARAAQQGITLAIDESSWRDYHVKLLVTVNGDAGGQAVVYYSPRKKQFTLVDRELVGNGTKQSIQKVFSQVTNQSISAPERSTTTVMKGYAAYVDGSYLDGCIGYGAVILLDGRLVSELNGQVHHSHESRQVAGEVTAVMRVMEYCKANGIAQISIYYDYEGISKWAQGQWKANLLLTQRYREFMKDCPVKVTFHKVRAHTGDTWNERADALARTGAKGEGA